MAGTFDSRLRDLMRARGHISTANKSGADVRALAVATGITYEMARRYVEGKAIPRADRLARIAEWLGTTPGDLLYGEPAATTNRIIITEVLQACIAAAERAKTISGQTMSPEQTARLVALLYEEAIDGRPASDGLIARLLRYL